jgi:O-methyltransferase
MNKYLYLFRFASAHPRLALASWQVKREKKTYLSHQHLFSLAQNYFTVRARCGPSLSLAEFGVGRGGSATILAWLVHRYGGTLTLYDVFGRIPEPSEKDGDRAHARYRIITEQEADTYYGNVPTLLDDIRRDLSNVCDLTKVRFVQGRYEETLPHEHAGPYHMAHIDCDWYESVRAVLAFLEPRLCPGAMLQIDDYSNWQGSRASVDEATWLAPYRRWVVGGPLVIDTGYPTDS